MQVRPVASDSSPAALVSLSNLKLIDPHVNQDSISAHVTVCTYFRPTIAVLAP